ncbi:YjbH domain-containing protein [Pseudoalteromonas sp. SMS1]|uniref:YjbH domain-containing protein n=1 Tax=Pseudoalteromonas sp. SMS1 TaxID=2908894 RepID=UPI001F2AF828|nr:YjbH domain-containing protein [Pseudoalteromonas sp. SMS1]MCF2857390.1 YjbH domain-containing protein [Pseudoalteromonas sp. SMS1]
MSKFIPLFISSFAVVAAPSFASEEHLDTYRTFTGFTGLINTSNAEVLERGNWDIGYNNMLDFAGVNYVDGHNIAFSAGIFDGLEVSGFSASNSMNDNLFDPNSEAEGKQIRDLSFNAKYRIPWVPKDWFSLSLGAKDIGGSSNKYETYFAVASKEWEDFRFSVGLATSDHVTGMMDGAFGGVEWLPLDWFALQVEYDAEAVNAAARFTVPKEWLFDLGELTLTSRFYSNTDHSEDDIYWGVNFKAPFSDEYQNGKKRILAAPAPVITNNQGAITAPPSERASKTLHTHTEVAAANEKVAAKASMNKAARKLRNMLIADGFESVRVGFNQQPVVVVSFENSVFNRNEIDALGLVAGRITTLFEDSQAQFVIQLKNHGLPMLSVSGDVVSYGRFISHSESPRLSVKMGVMPSVGGVSWVGLESANQPYFKPRLTLSPELSSTHATELGVFDYSLALKADITVPMWKGGGFNVSAQTVVSESSDFENGQAFDGRSEDNGINNAFFYQTFQLPWGIYNQTKIGYFKEHHKYTGIINETAWVSPDGNHKFTNIYGFFDYKDYDSDRDYHTLGYQYNWAEKDITFHVTGGKFWRKDSGVRVETRFWFGDSYVALYGEETNAQLAGIAISIPLSKRKSMNVTQFGQVKGNHAWRHQVGTKIGESNNYLVYQQAYMPQTSVSLDRTFFNQGRTSVDYVYSNLQRLREAYLTYK